MILRLQFVVSILLLGNSLAVNPGLRITLTSKGLNYIRQVAVPILEESLSSLSIPDISGSAGTPIGSISYSLSNIKLGGFNIPTSSMTFVPGKGILVQASGISTSVTANWHYRENSWPHISDGGSCDVSVSSVSLSLSVLLGADSQGHATLSTTGCSLSIGHLDIHFHGGASWLYNLFSDTIADSFKGSIQSEVCSQATSEINKQGNAALESVPIIVKIDSTSEINFALLMPPTFNTTYFETDHKGEFFSIVKPVESPYTPSPLPLFTNSGHMMYVWLTDYIANTAGYVYFQADILNYNITADMVPKDFPLQLNTSSFKLIVPALYDTYPKMAMMLGLVTVSPPNLTITSTSADFVLSGTVDVYVVNQTTKENIAAFTLGIIVYADVQVKVAPSAGKEIINANFTFLKATIKLVKSAVGDINIGLLQTAANLLCTAFIIPTANHYANAGIPIPVVDGVSFVNPSISFGQGYALVSTDISYKP